MFAVIQTGGKQYKVEPGQKIQVEKINGEKDSAVLFENVLLMADGESVRIGFPFISGACVKGKIISQSREKKKIVFRYHSKTRYRKKKGHRQHFTRVEIQDFSK